MLLEAATAADPAAAAGTALGAALGALAQSGLGGLLLALVVLFQGFGFAKDWQARKKTDELDDLRQRLEACERWQAAQDKERAIAEARAEGARQATAEHTGRHRRGAP